MTFSGTGSMYANPYDSSFISTSLSRNINAGQWRSGVIGWEQPAQSVNARNNGGLSANDAKSYMANLKKFGGGLRATTSNFLSAESLFNRLLGSSSNPSAAGIEVTNQRNANAFFNAGGTMSLSINQLAQSQENRSNSLLATGINNVQSGFNHFSIEKDGRTSNFNITVNATDSNRTVQQKMADAINRQNTGITARVDYNATTRESALVLTTRETGANQSFSIQDTNGNAVSNLGIGNMTRQAQDASYTVDGNAYTSNTNTVELSNGLSATFLKEANSIDINVARDDKSINNAIRELVNNFNQLREAAMDNRTDRGAQNLISRLDGLSSAFSVSLSRAGVTQNRDGYLQIDTEKLEASIKDGSAERTFGANAGFTQRLNTVADMAEKNPNQFISHQSRTNMNATASNSNYLDNIRFTASQHNKINNWDMVGMLFGFGI
jgi:flagellar capping protein FliD